MRVIPGSHCQQCGATYEFGDTDDGYTPCCNERLVSDCDPADCYHE